MPRKKSTIIVSHKIARRNPVLSFTLSLLFTGLGQAYNGKLSQGLTLLAVRTLALLLIPFTSLAREAHSHLVSFVVLSIAAAVVTAASPVEATVSSLLQKELPLKRYNSPFVYAGYATAAVFVTAMALTAAAAFFTLGTPRDDSALPSASPEETLLIMTYHPGQYEKGDLVLYGGGKIGRVMAGAGATVQAERNCFAIDGTPLSFGRWEDEGTGKVPEKLLAAIHVEKGNGREYPILAEFTGEKKSMAPVTIPGNSYYIAADNRVPEAAGEIVPAGDIKGRVEGILLTPHCTRMLMKPYVKAQNLP